MISTIVNAVHDKYRLIFPHMSCLIGILFANGEVWKEMRRFALTTLRDFGMGKSLAEDKILEECRHLIQMFEEQKGMESIYGVKIQDTVF